MWFALYPHAGGGRGTYLDLVAALRDAGHCHIPVLPGRDQRYREPALRSFPALADDLWGQLTAAAGRDASAPSDLVLFGFSMGALLAAEMAVRLEAAGAGPRRLVVAGCPPPERLGRLGLAGLPDDAFVAALAAQGAMPDSVLSEPELVSIMLPIWRADCAAVDSHPRRPAHLRCPVVAFGGDGDSSVPLASLAGWAETGGPGSAVHVVPGGHGDVLSQRHLLLRALTTGAGPEVAPAGGRRGGRAW